MSAKTNSKTGPDKASLHFAILCLAAASITRVALLQRGPDLSVMTDMATHAVVMPDGRAIYVQKHEVTGTEWNKCAAKGDCDITLRARPDHDPTTTPAVWKSHLDAAQYVGWISRITGHLFLAHRTGVFRHDHSGSAGRS